MNIPGFTTQTIIEFHEKIRECSDKDDCNPLREKVYGVRSFNDWREFSDSVEAELRQRNIPVKQIQW
jgi:hypothetical protein